MGSRKRAKPNPPSQPPVDNSTVDPTFSPSSNPDTLGGSLTAADGGGSPSRQVDTGSSVGTPVSTRSWYGGTWPRISKSTPITQVARETISTASLVNETAGPRPTSRPEHPATPEAKQGLQRPPSLYLRHSIQTSSRSLPAAAATTKLNITSNGLVDDHISEVRECVTEEHPTKLDEEESVSDSKIPENLEGQEKAPPVPVLDSAMISQYGWFGWFSRATTAEHGVESQQPSHGTPFTEGAQIEVPQSGQAGGLSSIPTQSPDQLKDPNNDPDIASITQNSRPWFGFWSGSTPAQGQSEHSASSNMPDQTLSKSRPLPSAGHNIAWENTARGLVDTSMAEAPPEFSLAKSKPMPDRSSGWGFWSRERGKSTADDPAAVDIVGELSVADTPSQLQSHSQGAKCAESNASASFETTKLGKRGRPKSLDISDDSASNKLPPGPMVSNQRPVEQTAKQQKAMSPNLLLPSFRNTYHQEENSSILQQLARLLLQGKQEQAKHVHIVRDPPLVRRAIAIGIHGYFPAPLIRSVLGQPTGTSTRFANSAAAAIKKWTESRGYECEIEKVALEGEGKIGERVDTLWKLMLNWIDQIQKADIILIACHSQGVPVAIMLVAKLIDFGCLSAARIGVCAMAGVNLGPFPDYKSRLFNGSAGELFEFSNPDSLVSKKYGDAMRVVVKHGVRLLLVGSIDDQLVSLESSTFSTISHPYIYRAVFVDGRVHAPDFITHLVGFALKLRNLGISDHGLIRELSAPLAGSLYTGEGHSRIYDDELVYDLAVEHALETSSVGDVPLQVSKYEAPTNSNPFILPWSMRGLLEEEYVKTELDNETAQLLEQFDNWKPTSKVLKDVKFRLEAVKSKL
ncbi:hypothetical protein FGG08_006509 [Glutinoglossum americanum]|uniref:YMC020W-like alpha/beta hydrolase domain-containing protein n=1 Tax=Glutinoglossum americanum TaxID=1670608 RepID=A0A9P8HSI3_9PEZI|nr:hypothetical protein FGG08_006509 [Glutinoglossum americanum]